jgi:hypothetical protein
VAWGRLRSRFLGRCQEFWPANHWAQPQAATLVPAVPSSSLFCLGLTSWHTTFCLGVVPSVLKGNVLYVSAHLSGDLDIAMLQNLQ